MNSLYNKKETNIPLVVDLDGTLLKSDTLVESGLLFFMDKPLQIVNLLRWITGGKLNLKIKLAEAVDLNVSTLPYNTTIIEKIILERSKGRKIILATGCYKSLAIKIADHLKIFDEVIASEAEQNVIGEKKCKILVKRYGEKGFDYIGNSKDDLVVWEQANKAFGVDVSKTTQRKSKLYSVNKNFAFSIFVFLRPRFEPIPKKTILA